MSFTRALMVTSTVFSCPKPQAMSKPSRSASWTNKPTNFKVHVHTPFANCAIETIANGTVKILDTPPKTLKEQNASVIVASEDGLYTVALRVEIVAVTVKDSVRPEKKEEFQWPPAGHSYQRTGS